MSQSADLGSKRLISLAPNNWARWVTQMPRVEVREFLSSDFQFIGRQNDVLLKVSTPEGEEFLLLNEIQLRPSGRMPKRIRAYSALAEERYDLPVYPVLVNILPPGANPQIPTRYQSNFRGIQAYQDYRVINLWEVEVNVVFEQQLSSLLPFVPVLKGGGEEVVVRQALNELRDDERLSELEPLLSFFASFVLELPVVQQIMRWDMAVIRESPWYLEILREGEQRGRQEGEVKVILGQLTYRFGDLDDALQARVRQLSIAQLDELSKSLLDFSSLVDLESWLEEHQN